MKKNSLANYVQPVIPAAPPSIPAAPDADQAQQPVKPKRGRKASIQSAEELVQLGFRLPRSRWSRLHEAAIHDRSSVQAIVVEALERHFSARGLKF
jgi:hypothetical protein